MKRLIAIAIVASTVFGLSARGQNRVQSDLQKLLALHRTEMQTFFAGMQQTNRMVPAFFCDVSFTSDAQVERFLRNVSANAPQGQLYSQTSYTQFISINGEQRSISYNLVNNGGNVTFVKSTNVNGQLLKAVYEFDAASRKLKADTFNGKKAFKHAEYSI